MPLTNSKAIPQDPFPILRVVLPAKVAFDLGSIQRVLENLSRAIGCEACFSGRSCIFQMENDWVVNPESLELEGISHWG